MTQPSSTPVVLVVEDEPDIVETYEIWLRDTCTVYSAETGEEALDILGERDIDVVLLDRMLPGMSGDEVLRRIRASDEDCRVAMVSAVTPGIDIVEMGFDGYVTKPPDRDELRDTVRRLFERSMLDDDLQEYYSLIARKSALESEFSAAELAGIEEYRTLLERIELRRSTIDESIPDLGSDTDFVAAVREIEGGAESDTTGDDDAD